MAKTVDDMINDIIKREGGYVNHPADKGGPTNMGVTQKTLSAWLNRPATIQDVQNLAPDTARQIFRSNYFEKPGFDKLPAAVQPIVFDAAVLHGPQKATQLLQQSLNEQGFSTGTDGKLGPETIRQAAAASKKDPTALVNEMVDQRLDYNQKIVDNNSKQEVFLKGWNNRANSFRTDPSTSTTPSPTEPPTPSTTTAPSPAAPPRPSTTTTPTPALDPTPAGRPSASADPDGDTEPNVIHADPSDPSVVSGGGGGGGGEQPATGPGQPYS